MPIEIEPEPDWYDDEYAPAWAERNPRPRSRGVVEPEVYVHKPEVLGYVMNGDEVEYTILKSRPVRFGFQLPENCYEDEPDEPA